MTNAVALWILSLASPMGQGPTCRLTIIPSAAWIQPGKSFQIALKFGIQQGWHIYWQNPGDSGVPTEVKWSLPPGFRVLRVDWSAPKRVDAAGIVSFGLEKEAFAIATVRAPAQIASAAIKVNADWLICKEICIEGKGSAVAWLPVKSEKPSSTAGFRKALASLPLSRHALLIRAQTNVMGYELQVRHSTHKGVGAKTAFFYPFEDDVIAHSKPQSVKTVGSMFTLSIPRSRFHRGTVKRLRGILEFGYNPKALSSIVVDVPVSS